MNDLEMVTTSIEENQVTDTTNEQLENGLNNNGMTLEERAMDLEIGLQWIRKELDEMKAQDRTLTKEIGGLRGKVDKIRDLIRPEKKDAN